MAVLIKAIYIKYFLVKNIYICDLILLEEEEEAGIQTAPVFSSRCNKSEESKAFLSLILLSIYGIYKPQKRILTGWAHVICSFFELSIGQRGRV